MLSSGGLGAIAFWSVPDGCDVNTGLSDKVHEAVLDVEAHFVLIASWAGFWLVAVLLARIVFSDGRDLDCLRIGCFLRE